MRYKCVDCGEVFDEPRVVLERHGFNDGFAERFECCPYCGGAYDECADEEVSID